jgi:hypothetical protein
MENSLKEDIPHSTTSLPLQVGAELSFHKCSSKLSMLKIILKRGGVSHCGLAIYIRKYLKAKEEL